MTWGNSRYWGGGFQGNKPAGSASEGAPSYYVDATSNIAWPRGSSEYTSFLTTNSSTLNMWSIPDHQHDCQESGGNLSPLIGGLTLTANAGPAYNQALAGWSLLGVRGDGVTANQRFQNIAAFDPSTTSFIMMGLVALGTQDSTVRTVFGVGALSDTTVGAYLNTTKRLRYRESGNVVDTSGANEYSSVAVPVVLLVDHTNTRARVFTPYEKLSPTYGLPSATSSYFIGGTSGTWAASTIGGLVGWTGTKAQRTDADVKALFEAMGYTIGWS